MIEVDGEGAVAHALKDIAKVAGQGLNQALPVAVGAGRCRA